MAKKEDKNQLSIFDFFKEEKPAVLYHKGDILFQQFKGNVEKYIVTGETWLYRDGECRGYCLQHENGRYNTVTNESTEFYHTYEDAKKAAQDWLMGKDIIYPEQIQFVSVEAYQYVRECDNRIMTAFLGVMKNGDLYIKNFYTYHHIVKDNKKVRKNFQEEIEQYASYSNCNVKKLENFVPNVKLMYRCKKDKDWNYAEAGYGGAIG